MLQNKVRTQKFYILLLYSVTIIEKVIFINYKMIIYETSMWNLYLQNYTTKVVNETIFTLFSFPNFWFLSEYSVCN